MWQIEQEHYDGGRVRWTPVKGERYVDREKAEAWLRVILQRALKDAAASGQARTGRFRVVPVVEACAVMQ